MNREIGKGSGGDGRGEAGKDATRRHKIDEITAETLASPCGAQDAKASCSLNGGHNTKQSIHRPIKCAV